MIYRTLSRRLLPASLALILTACGASQNNMRAVEEAAALEAAHRQAEEQAAAARAAEEQVAAEQARLAAQKAERERAAAAHQAQREAAEIAQREAEQTRLQSEVRAREQTQQVRVTQLERQIENSSNAVRELTQVNNSLEQAVVAAEELLRTLNEEQLKYANTTPAGELLEPLDKDRIAELEARMEALKRAAESPSR